MFKKLQDILNQIKEAADLQKKKEKNYISSITDEIVRKSGFSPIKRGGKSGKTHRLVIDENMNYVFKTSFFPNIFLILFFFLFFSPIFISLDIQMKSNGDGIDYSSLTGYGTEVFIILLLVTISFLVYYYFFNSFIFDFQNGYFYNKKYKKNLFEYLKNDNYKTKIIPIDKIHALQITKESVRGNKTTFTSYELNMILKDSSRVNIVDHSNLDEIRSNANELSYRLGVKVYDIIDL